MSITYKLHFCITNLYTGLGLQAHIRDMEIFELVLYSHVVHFLLKFKKSIKTLLENLPKFKRKTIKILLLLYNINSIQDQINKEEFRQIQLFFK